MGPVKFISAKQCPIYSPKMKVKNKTSTFSVQVDTQQFTRNAISSLLISFLSHIDVLYIGHERRCPAAAYFWNYITKIHVM